MNINNYINQISRNEKNESSIKGENSFLENFGEKYRDNDNDSYIMSRNEVDKYFLSKTLEKEKSINSKKNDTKNRDNPKNISNWNKNFIKNNEVQN